ncbi:MAG: hypothetical protein Q4C96_04940 [Planctomycetia bacterium]|nr:hypothetical protein [Planctomycetia bacterium]
MSGHSWLFTKKRGNRRTGSRLSGLFAEILFAFFCLLSGIIGLIWIFITYVVPEWRVHDQYVHTTCMIEDTRISERRISGETLLSSETEMIEDIPEEGNSSLIKEDEKAHDALWISAQQNKKPAITALKRPRGFISQYKPEVKIRYEANGITYSSWTYDIHTVSGHKYYDSYEEVEELIGDLRKDTPYHCWYDPKNPEHVVLVSYWNWEHWFSLLIPVSLIILGGGMLVHLIFYSSFGSREYSVVTAQRGPTIAPFLSDQTKISPFPNIPDGSLITDSPGVRLAYRLPMDSSSAWRLIALTVVAVLWNVFVLFQLTITTNDFMAGNKDWIRILYMLPFFASGVVLAWIVLKQIRRATKIGLTFVEIGHFPIRPAEPCPIFVSQGGHLQMYWLNVMLVCEEEAIFTHGTNTRREVQRVFQKQLFCEEGFTITVSAPFECDFLLTLPEHAMHSFVSARNQIKWQIIIQGAAAGIPVFERVFPIIVYPKKSEDNETVIH